LPLTAFWLYAAFNDKYGDTALLTAIQFAGGLVAGPVCKLDRRWSTRTAQGRYGTAHDQDICLKLLATKGIAEPTREQARDMIGAVHRSLINHEGKSVERAGEGMPARWLLLT
jgi:hypothetical protein